MVTALLLTVTWVVCGVAYHHLSFANRSDHAQRAQNLAEAAVSLGMAKVLEDPDYGPEDPALVVPFDENGSGWLSFAPVPERPLSTNNLAGDNSVPGWNERVVPKHSVLLIGEGRYGSVSRRVEALMYVPPFPYSIASEGRFLATGPLLVASVGEPGAQELMPGHLVSNASGDVAIETESEAEITGDLQAVGGARLSSTTRVMGETRLHDAPATLPVVEVRDYDPQAQGKPAQNAPSYLKAPILEGFVRRAGDLQIQDGLEMQGASIFVDGNLTIEGGVRGRGALFVTGNALLLGGSALSSDNQAALVVGGHVEVRSDNRERSYFQGLIYSGGNLSAEQVTLMGPMVSRGEGGVQIKDASLLYYAPYAQLDLRKGWTPFTFARANGAFIGTFKAQDDESKVVLEISHSVNGSYTVRDPNGMDTEGLTLEGAMARIRELVPGEKTQEATTNLKQLSKALLDLPRRPEDGRTERIVDFDLNRFLPLSDKVRLLYWRLL